MPYFFHTCYLYITNNAIIIKKVEQNKQTFICPKNAFCKAKVCYGAGYFY